MSSLSKTRTPAKASRARPAAKRQRVAKAQPPVNIKPDNNKPVECQPVSLEQISRLMPHRNVKPEWFDDGLSVDDDQA